MTQEEQERQRILEEIRRRSEEAELKRIEEEEHGAHPTPSPPPQQPPRPPQGFPAAFPSRPIEPAAAPKRAVVEQRVAALRERFSIALDRGRLDKASEILNELGALLPGGPELQGYRERLRLAEEEKARAREKRKSSVAPAPEPERVRQPQPRIDIKKLMELIDSANALYQQEKYESALKAIDEALTLAPGNEDATRLREEIQRARKLAESIRQEEVKHREEEASMRGPVAPQPVVPLQVDHDPWGTASTMAPQHPEVGFDIPPEEKGPAGPPKPPFLEQLVERASRIRIPVRPILTFLGIILIGVVVYLVIDNIRTAVTPPRYSVLVLPAVAQGADSALAVLADGVTYDLIASLAGVTDLRVINPVSAFEVRRVAPRAAAQGVGANYVVEWSIAAVPTGVEANVTLRDTLSGAAVWSLQQQTSIHELPVLLRKVAEGILGAMRFDLSENERGRMGYALATVPGAYESYARGRSLQQHQLEEASLAIAAFNHAASLDAKFVSAWSGLGRSYILASEAEPSPSKRFIALAASSLQKALDLGSQSAETYLAWALIDLEQAQYETAIERLEEASSAAPGNAEVQRRLALAYILRGKEDDALKAARRAVADDPRNPDSYTVLGLIHQYRREYKEAGQAYAQGMPLSADRSAYAIGPYADVLVYLQQHDRAIEVLLDRAARVRQDPEPLYRLARVQQTVGQPKQDWTEALVRAAELLKGHVAANPGDGRAFARLALVQTRLGEFREAHASSARALKIAPNDVHVLYLTARMHTLQRDKGHALEYLKKAIDSRFSLAAVLDMDYFNLRNDPEFQQALLR